ncbi:MAG: hypothetical protein KatS3mg095_1005 [Candidatus Parcubacteria bacterium]|nr:MAG: hypothetical protein KatS3mg095_1005 [Candidatus Parcubacteria bacterium]
MKKFLLISIIFIGLSLAFAQTTQIDQNLLKQIVEILQKLTQQAPSSQPQPPVQKGTETLVPTPANLPKGIQPAVPATQTPLTPEVIKPILPDENREDDTIVQLNNLRITRIVKEPGIENAKAIFFAARDIGWKCLMLESEESEASLPCVLELRRPISLKELAIKITDETILLQRNRQKAKLDDFNVGDKINVYGFMDKDNYGIEGLIVRKISSMTVPKPLNTTLRKISETPKKSEICIQVITPAYNPKNPSECKEFPTPCDIPDGWMKTNKCPVSLATTTQLIISLTNAIELKVEADDYGFYPASIEVPQNTKVILYLIVKNQNVYYGGLDFRSEKFKTEPIKPGQSTKVEFTADKNFIIESYWPLSNVKKSELKIIIK